MTWWHYLILVNFYLVLFYGFYALLLQRETFFQLNRIYLVNAAILSFLIPLIHSGWVKSLFITQKVQSTIYSSPVMVYQFKQTDNAHLNLGQLFAGLYIAGIIILSLRLAWQLIQLNRIIRHPKPTASYSFFNKIKLEDDSVNRKVIFAHERAHVKQCHSVDVLIIEVVMIINWFNPVIYFYRLAIKQIHEYIADKQALKAGTTRSEYALLLLSKTFGAPTHQLVNPFFNKSLLKRRILMLQKSNSKKVALAKYGLSAPLFILMLILSSATVNNSKTIKVINKKAESVFSTDASNAITDLSHAEIPDDIVKAAPVKKATKKHNASENIAVNEQGAPEKPSYITVEKMPEFPDGMKAFFQFISRTIKYPVGMRENNIQGKAYISFVIEEDGSVSDVKSVNDPGYGSGEEGVRVISLSPKWNPAIKDGKAVRVQCTIPINFTLANESEDPKPKSSNGTIADTTKTTAFVSPNNIKMPNNILSAISRKNAH
jgi:beta-lactamase regulating signal transducer with metallopeptidase domain